MTLNDKTSRQCCKRTEIGLEEGRGAGLRRCLFVYSDIGADTLRHAVDGKDMTFPIRHSDDSSRANPL